MLLKSDSVVTFMCDMLPARTLRGGTKFCASPGARLLKIHTTGSPGMDTENLLSPSSQTFPCLWPALQLDQSNRKSCCKVTGRSLSAFSSFSVCAAEAMVSEGRLTADMLSRVLEVMDDLRRCGRSALLCTLPLRWIAQIPASSVLEMTLFCATGWPRGAPLLSRMTPRTLIRRNESQVVS